MFALLIVDAVDAGRRRRPDLRPPDVPHEDRHAARGVQHDVLDISYRSNQPDAAHDHALLLIVEHRAARVLVVGADGLRNLTDGQAVFFQLESISSNLLLLAQPTDWDHIRHARYLQQARDDSPVLNLAQLQDVVSGPFQPIAVHLADAGGERPQ